MTNPIDFTIKDPDAMRYALMANEGQGMAKGGKVIKGALQKVLPKTEYEANLAKFIQDSQMPEGYHGTRQLTEKYDQAPAIKQFRDFDRPVWVSRHPELANDYVSVIDGTGAVYPLHVSAKNPLRLRDDMDWQLRDSPHATEMLTKYGIEHHPDDYVYSHVNTPEFRDEAMKEGYDSIFVNESGHPTAGVFSGAQLKSRTGNNGKFDPYSEDIGMAKGGQAVKKMLKMIPAAPGTTPIRDGHVRLYHQTDGDSLRSIEQQGLLLEHAKGIEGPRAIYAGETPFYGPADSRPTLEFQVPKEKWDAPFVLQDVKPEDMIAAHYPWHRHARYLDNESSVKNVLEGKFDGLGGDSGAAVDYIRDKYSFAEGGIVASDLDRERSSFSVYSKPTYASDVPQVGQPTVDQMRHDLTRERPWSDVLSGVPQTARTLASGMARGVAAPWVALASPEAAKSLEEGAYTPDDPNAIANLQFIGNTVEDISRSLNHPRIPEFIPEALALQYMPGIGTQLKSGAIGLADKGLGMYEAGQLTPGFNPTSAAVKPKGGNWLTGSVEDGIKPLRLPDRPVARDMQGNVVEGGGLLANSPTYTTYEAINGWLDKRLVPYIKNEMGTPDDPIRLMHERGVSHIPINESEMGEWLPQDVADSRVRAGYPEEGFAIRRHHEAGYPEANELNARHAEDWETRTDKAIIPEEASTLKMDHILKDNPWISKLPGHTPVHSLDGSAPEHEFQGLGFQHIVDELKNATNPVSGLPNHLQIDPAKLGKMTVPGVVKHVHEINQWRKENMGKAALQLTEGMPVHKEYPEQGFKWLELTTPKAPEGWVQEGSAWRHPTDGAQKWVYPDDALHKALKYEGDTMGHCVGSYCDDVASGKSRIYTLRDKKNEPHVTIEVTPVSGSYGSSQLEAWHQQAARELSNSGLDPQSAKFATAAQKRVNELAKEYKDNPPLMIKHIKGKANLKPNDKYLPFVQDFIRSGKWSQIGDLDNSGLRHRANVFNDVEQKLIMDAGHELPEYMTPDEIKVINRKVWPNVDPAPTEPPGMRSGGPVHFAEGGDVDAMRAEMSETGYKSGGRVITRQLVGMRGKIPTEAQKRAGNYKKGHVRFNGMGISIENPVGSVRSGKGPDGAPWSVKMSSHYGYVKRTKGADGDHVDVYLAPGAKHSAPAFVFDQHDPVTGKFDEHKAVLGVHDQKQAESIYDAHFSDGSGPRRRRAVRKMHIEHFKDWAQSHHATKPVIHFTDKIDEMRRELLKGGK